MYRVKAYCAGIILFNAEVKEEELFDFLTLKKDELKRGELRIHFGLDISQIASEMCVDVYDEIGTYRPDLSMAAKR